MLPPPTLLFLQFLRLYMRPVEVASLLSSCSYVGARPDDRLMLLLLRDMQNMYTDASGDDMANVAMALAQYQYRPA